MKNANPLIRFTFLTLLLSSVPVQAEKIWTNSASGLWSVGLNWSGHTPPDITAFIRITNDLSKTITIDANTADTNLTVQSLLLNAPPGATNLLLLSNVGVTNPLIFQTGLELQDGAAIRVTNSALQTQLANDHVNIDGTITLDSGLIDFGDVTVTSRVGRATSGMLTINGGTASVGVMTVGGLTNSSGAVQIDGGTLNVAGLLSIARNPSTTGTVAVLGGQLNVPNDDTRVGDSGIGFLTVSNSNLTLTNLYVGRDPAAFGQVTLQSGGVIRTASGVIIAQFGGATGVVSVTGGQLLAPGQKISIGRGGNAQLTVSGGTVQAAQILVAAEGTNSAGGTGIFSIGGGSSLVASNLAVGVASSSTGQVFMTAGTLAITNTGGSGLLNIPSGSVTMSGGDVSADSLVVTNSAGQFLLRGGTLSSRSTTIANGAAFVVGDGLTPTTFHLNGGTHVFANGLLISSNATLNGCGTIIGSVINHGIIATNCGTTTISQPTLSFVSRTGTTNLLSFESTSGATYTLQFKNSITDPAWTSLAPATNGTGSAVLIRDITSSATRFYRLSAQ